MTTTTTATATQDELADFLLSCRYDEAEEVRAFLARFGAGGLQAAADERGNTALHMACGNGHVDVLKALLEAAPAALLQRTNEAGSPPMHWAVMNNHVACVQALVDLPEERGGGIPLLKQKNAAGRDAFDEAVFAGDGKEEVAGWIEGYVWKAEGGKDAGDGKDADGDAATEQTEEVTLKMGDTSGVGAVTEEVDLSAHTEALKVDDKSA